VRATETGAKPSSPKEPGRRSSAIVRAKVSLAWGPTTAFDPQAAVVSTTEAKELPPPADSSASLTPGVSSGQLTAITRLGDIGHHQVPSCRVARPGSSATPPISPETIAFTLSGAAWSSSLPRQERSATPTLAMQAAVSLAGSP
jgi:hypothetical protein